MSTSPETLDLWLRETCAELVHARKELARLREREAELVQSALARIQEHRAAPLLVASVRELLDIVAARHGSLYEGAQTRAQEALRKAGEEP